jgi:hypothetical protein
MKLLLKIHSIIDVITNSSTEIFTFANNDAVEKAYEMLNEILKISNSDKKAEDLFNIRIVPDISQIDNYICKIEDIEEAESIFNSEKIINMFKEYFSLSNKKEDWRIKSDYRKKMYEALIEENLWKVLVEEHESDEYPCESFVEIIAKDKNKSTKNIMSMFDSLIYQNAWRCG